MMLSIFSCAYWLFVCLLWRNIYSDSLPIFVFELIELYYQVVRILNMFWIHIPDKIYDVQIFSTQFVGKQYRIKHLFLSPP